MSPCYSLRNKRVWVAGHRGMVGGAVLRRLESKKCEVLISPVDLRRQAEAEEWLAVNRPDAIVLAAARVGGIAANGTYPADFIYDNLMIEANVIHGAFKAGVEKLLFLGSSCIYPRAAAQPIAEEALLSGPLEPTNEWYAAAKIAGIKLCQAYRRQHGCDFIAAMPCNLYGPGDTYDSERSHVIPALIMKMHEAKVRRRESVEIWGTGRALREFLHADDLADALVLLLERYTGEAPVNIGSGSEVSIIYLAGLVAETVGYEGRFAFGADRPDGTPRKLLDSSRINALGWRAATGLKAGLAQAYNWYLENIEAAHAA